MRDPESIAVNEDERMIPVWSIIVASVAFVLVEYYFWMVAPEQRHHAPPPLGFRIYFNLSWGVVVALYFLMVGYISKDSPRRAMSARFWMLICFVMPGGIGAVLYFLLRQPQVAAAPPAARMCRAISTFARSATTSLRRIAATASGQCAPPTSTARAAATNWPRTRCRRGCTCWEIDFGLRDHFGDKKTREGWVPVRSG